MTPTINALIIDDEAKSRNILKWMLEKYCPEVNIVGLAATIEEAEKKINSTSPNLLFLDVELTNGTSFDLLRRIKFIDFEVIFVTAFNHYALQAIKYHALDYILKPVDIDELSEAVNKVAIQFNKKMDTERLEKLLLNLQQKNVENQQIAIIRSDGREFVPLNQIIRCVAEGASTWLHLEGGRKILSTKNLGEYEKIFPAIEGQYQNYFFRIHYSHIINMSHIVKYNRREKTVEMKGSDAKITIAQRRVTQFLEIMNQMNL